MVQQAIEPGNQGKRFADKLADKSVDIDCRPAADKLAKLAEHRLAE